MSEVWKEIPDYEGTYEVSDHGRVRSVARVQAWGSKWGTVGSRAVPSRILRHWQDRLGYWRIRLTKGGVGRSATIHQLVACAFLGSPPENHEVAHLNGNPSDNRLENLRYVTHLENEAHKIVHNSLPYGDRASWRKVDEADVERILEALLFGAYQKDLASVYGLCQQSISRMKCGLNWRRIGIRIVRTPIEALRAIGATTEQSCPRPSP